MSVIAAEPSSLEQRNVGALLSGLNHLSLWRGRTVVLTCGGSATISHRFRSGDAWVMRLAGDVARR